MNAWVIKLTISELEELIKAAKKDGASQRVITKFEGKGYPECICLVTEDKK